MNRLLLILAVFVSGCITSPEPPATPPEYTEPPAVATDNAIRIVVSTDVPMGLDELRDFLIANPLIEFFESTPSIAAPDTWTALKGTWLEPGASRRLKLADGHYVIERVLDNEPDRFRYQVWTFTNAAGKGIEQIIGEQRFFVLGDRLTRFEWTYNIKPKSPFAAFFVRRRESELKTYLQSATTAMRDAATVASGINGG
ncbi:MAG: hypothetical protein AAAFM81_15480 [Pseudomonadota bacterium]